MMASIFLSPPVCNDDLFREDSGWIKDEITTEVNSIGYFFLK